MLQYVELVKSEHGYKTVPNITIELPELPRNSAGLWVYEGKAVAVLVKTRFETFTTVIADGQGFQCAVPLPPVKSYTKWTSNKLVYSKFKEVAASGNYYPLKWAISLQELGLSDCNRIATLLSSETIPYVWGQVVEDLVGYLGMDKFLKLVHKTTYQDRDGSLRTVDQLLIYETAKIYEDLKSLGYCHLEKKNRNRDWRDLHRNLFDSYQKVRRKVQLPVTPEMSKLDGLAIDHGYKLAVPWSNVTLSQWGVDLDNCLSGYTDKILKGSCEVLGVFQDSNLVAAIEIINRKVTQLYGYRNSEPESLLADAVITALRQSGLVD
jgi:hypothetical protein